MIDWLGGTLSPEHQPTDQQKSTQADTCVDPIGIRGPKKSQIRLIHRSHASKSTTNKAPNTRNGVMIVTMDCASISNARIV